MMTAQKPSAKTLNFEKSVAELDKLVSKMESGNLPLEDSLKYFEQGISLIRQCQDALKHAEQKVKILTKDQDVCDFNLKDE